MANFKLQVRIWDYWIENNMVYVVLEAIGFRRRRFLQSIALANQVCDSRLVISILRPSSTSTTRQNHITKGGILLHRIFLRV